MGAGGRGGMRGANRLRTQLFHPQVSPQEAIGPWVLDSEVLASTCRQLKGNQSALLAHV